jgi:methylglyoxal synthase
MGSSCDVLFFYSDHPVASNTPAATTSDVEAQVRLPQVLEILVASNTAAATTSEEAQVRLPEEEAQVRLPAEKEVQVRLPAEDPDQVRLPEAQVRLAKVKLPGCG